MSTKQYVIKKTYRPNVFHSGVFCQKGVEHSKETVVEIIIFSLMLMHHGQENIWQIVDLSDCHLTYCHLPFVTWQIVNLAYCQLADCHSDFCHLTDCDLVDCQFTECYLAN